MASESANATTTDYMPLYAQLAREGRSHEIKVYGGFVRDFVVQNKSAVDGSVHDLDMYAQNSETRAVFEEHLRQSYGATQFNTEKPDTHYPFERSRWNITRETAADVTGRPLSDFPEYINIDLILCDVLPVNDFSANLLTWDGDNVSLEQPDPNWYDETGVIKPPTFVMKDIIADIHAHILEPFPSYLLKQQLKSGHAWFVRRERLNKFAARGWMMTHGPNSLQDRLACLKKELASIEALAARPAQLRTLISDTQEKLASFDKKRKRNEYGSDQKLDEISPNSHSSGSTLNTSVAHSLMNHISPTTATTTTTSTTTTSTATPAVSDDEALAQRRRLI